MFKSLLVILEIEKGTDNTRVCVCRGIVLCGRDTGLWEQNSGIKKGPTEMSILKSYDLISYDLTI